MKKTTLFQNFNVVDRGMIVKGGTVAVRGDKIVSPESDAGKPDEIIDGKGELYLSPGFIDIHTHGGGGYDFMDADAEEYHEIAKFHAVHGTTSLYATTVSASREELLAAIAAFGKAKTLPGGAKLLGIHLEGPYLALSQKGAMDERYIRNPVREEYTGLCELSDDIRRITFAPELDGAVELCAYLNSKKIIPSIGHTDAVCGDVVKAFHEGGCRLMTHLYSAMSMTRRIHAYRYAGAVEAAYLLDDLYVEIIADGKHLPKELLQLIYKIKGEDRVILITDSMRGAGMADGGSAILGSRKSGNEAIIEDGVAKLPDRSAFAGSIATADRLIRTMIRLAGVPLEKAVKMMTLTPAIAMGIDGERGSLENGKAADLAIFDGDIQMKYVMTEGNLVKLYNLP